MEWNGNTPRKVLSKDGYTMLIHIPGFLGKKAIVSDMRDFSILGSLTLHRISTLR